MNTLLVILGLILGAIGCMMLFFMDYAKEEPRLGSVIHLAIALIFVMTGFFMFGYYIKDDNGSFSSNDYNLKTEVRQEIK